MSDNDHSSLKYDVVGHSHPYDPANLFRVLKIISLDWDHPYQVIALNLFVVSDMCSERMENHKKFDCIYDSYKLDELNIFRGKKKHDVQGQKLDPNRIWKKNSWLGPSLNAERNIRELNLL